MLSTEGDCFVEYGHPVLESIYPSAAKGFEERTVALSLFDEVTQRLFQDPGLPRIKKLLVYTCNHIWESDSQRLSQYNLQDLIASLMAIAPTPDQLKRQLDSVVGTINKPVEYALVAQALVEHLDPLYRAPEDSFEVEQSQVKAIATHLESSPDPLRTRKLLYAACYRTWENNPDVLMQTHLESLVLTLHQLTLTPERLQAVLQSIVKTLNRQTEYSRIAQTIVQAFQPLYAEAQEPQTQIVITAPIEKQPEQTQIVMAADIGDQTQIAASPQPDLYSAPQEPVQGVVSSPYSLDNLFDLRIDLMKFTNPLRVKALVFSIVHAPLSDEFAIEAVLKEYELDDLLRALFQTHPGFDQLEAELKRVVQRLPAAGQYGQVCAALLRVVRPFYETGTDGLTLVTAPFGSGPNRRVANQEWGGDREETCQFSSLHLPAAMRQANGLGDDPNTTPLMASPPLSNA